MATLIVDDNAMTRSILTELASTWRMRPHACDSGYAALDELERATAAGEPYRVLLLDEHIARDGRIQRPGPHAAGSVCAACRDHDVDLPRPESPVLTVAASRASATT